MTIKLAKLMLSSVATGAVALAATAATAQSVQTVRNGTTLVTVGSTSPGTVSRSVTITGLGAGQTIAGLDYRPAAPRILYGISNIGQLYTIDSRSGVATAIGTPPLPTISAIGFDFNPTVDRLRIVTQVGQDVRANPDTGALAATDGTLAYAPTDSSAGSIPTVAAGAYTNNFAGATTTTLYVLDTRGALAPARLATQGNATVSPNTGQLFTVGSTGITSLGVSGFDIASTGQAFATFTDPTTRITSLYSINLTSGAATLVGALAGSTSYEGLAIALASFSSMGATANQTAVGLALDSYIGIPAGATLTLLNAVDSVAGTPGAQSAALSALSPSVYSNLPEVALNAVEVSETNVLRYARDLRGNASMPDGSTATLDEAGKIGAWLLGGGRLGTYRAAVDRPQTQIGGYHVLGGLDYRFAPAIALGAFGGYSKTDARLTPTSQQSGLESLFIGGYGTANIGPAYIDVWGSYTDLDFDLRRTIAIGTLSDSMTSRAKGRIWAAGASTGLSFDLGGFEVEPFAAVRYADVRINGFSESGSTAAVLSVGNIDRESIRSHVGLRIGADYEIGGVKVRPQLHGGWYHEFRNRPQFIAAAFQNPGLSGGSFGFTATPLAKDYYSAGGTLNVAGNGPLSLVADYNGQFARDRRIHTMTIGARLAF